MSPFVHGQGSSPITTQGLAHLEGSPVFPEPDKEKRRFGWRA